MFISVVTLFKPSEPFFFFNFLNQEWSLPLNVFLHSKPGLPIAYVLVDQILRAMLILVIGRSDEKKKKNKIEKEKVNKALIE